MSSSTSSTGVSTPPNSATSSGISRAAPTAARWSTDLRSIRAAAFMLDRREPRAESWAKLQAAIAAEPAPRGRVLGMPGAIRRSLATADWPVWLGAAAALDPRHRDRPAAADESAPPRTTTRPRTPATPTAEVTVESVTAEFEAAEKHYQKAIDDLQTIANKDTGELDPQVAAVLQKNLTVIDQAISESRAALQVPAGEHQRAGRVVRRAAHEGRAAAADRRADQRNAEGQSSRSGAPDPDPVAVAAYADQILLTRVMLGAALAAAAAPARPRSRCAACASTTHPRAPGSSATARRARARSRSTSSRRPFKVGDGAALDLSHLAGDVRVTGGSGNEIRIEATKRVRHRDAEEAKRLLQALRIEVNNFNGRVEVRTIYPRARRPCGNSISAQRRLRDRGPGRRRRVAQVDLGRHQRHRTCNGEVRAETVSGDVNVSGTPNVALAKTFRATSRRATSARRPRWC